MNDLPSIALIDLPSWLLPGGILLLAILAIFVVFVLLKYSGLWLQAWMSNADVSFISLIGMSLRRVNASSIVKAQVMAKQAGLTIAKGRGMTTASLETHYLAGGDVYRVVVAIIAANRAGIDLDFERAAAIDLAGRDLEEAVRTSIFPKVISCPEPNDSGNTQLSAIAKNGVELLARVSVTVRTNIDQLIGGATEQTIIARVGQGIVSTIGSMSSHEEALATPDSISKTVLNHRVESNTAYSVVSVDIATIDVGRNIGARLQSEQADADTRVARAKAESRRAEAIAWEQEMKAEVTAQKALLILAEAEIPSALAIALKKGQFESRSSSDLDTTPDPESNPDSILKFPGSQGATG
jgi:uncharacterized protein YqfA (UPF0365 family)